MIGTGDAVTFNRDFEMICDLYVCATEMDIERQVLLEAAVRGGCGCSIPLARNAPLTNV